MPDHELAHIERDLLRARTAFLQSAPAPASGDWQGVEAGADRGLGEVVILRDANGCGNALIPVMPSLAGFSTWTRKGVDASVQAMEYQRARKYFIRVRCTVQGADEAFLSLASDIVRELARLGRPAGEVVRDTLERHAAIFEHASAPIPRERLIGLMGELLVLNELLAHGLNIFPHWAGPAGGHQDFVFAQDAIEVKSRCATSQAVIHVHGLEQLEVPPNSALWLVTQELVETEANGLTLRDVVEMIAGRGVQPSKIAERLDIPESALLGAAAESTRFQARAPVVYRVDPEFPRIVASNLSSRGVPAGLERVQYSLRLAAVEQWRVSEAQWRKEIARIATTA